MRYLVVAMVCGCIGFLFGCLFRKSGKESEKERQLNPDYDK